MTIDTLNDALIDALKDIYSSENQIVKALPKMAKSAVNPKLRGGFELHTAQTQVHIERLNQISDLLKVKLTGKICKATEGLVEEGSEATKEKGKNKAAIDAILIGAARRVEHYEIAAYTSAIGMSDMLQLSDISKLLALTLAEEIKTDTTLNFLATSEILPEALSKKN